MLSRQSYSLLIIIAWFFSLPVAAEQPKIVERETLVSFDQEWSFWLSHQQPPNWPLVSMPADIGNAVSLQPQKERAVPDRVLEVGQPDGNMVTEGRWWGSFMAPFKIYSSAIWQKLLPRRLKGLKKRARKGLRYFSRTALVMGEHEKNPTTIYFVKSFNIDNPADFESFQVEAKFHQGMMLYLNGENIISQDMPESVVQHQTLASPRKANQKFIQMNVGKSKRWQFAWLGFSADLLVPGENIIAVELHRGAKQQNPSMYFDARVTAYKDFGWVKAPYLQSLRADGLVVSWETSSASTGVVEVRAKGSSKLQAFHSHNSITGHEVNIYGLKEDSVYEYRVLSDNGENTVRTAWNVFRTGITEHKPFRFILYGDSRGNHKVHRKLADMMKEDARTIGGDFVIHTGDIVTYGYDWELWQAKFFWPAGPLMETVPIYAALGNHEVNQQLYYDYFALPHNESWYTFTYGDAEFFALNTNYKFGKGSEQYQWFENALRQSTKTWKVVFFHHPPHSCAIARKPGHRGVQKHLVPLMEQFGVQLVLLGHDHLYGRTKEINGVTYVTSGGGGAGLYSVRTDKINKICFKVHNYVRFKVGKKTIQWDAIDLSGNIIDSHSIRP